MSIDEKLKNLAKETMYSYEEIREVYLNAPNIKRYSHISSYREIQIYLLLHRKCIIN